ncbi:hypothetical protein VTL71DRAFT_15930, partial [Oculimacula yallundae]
MELSASTTRPRSLVAATSPSSSPSDPGSRVQYSVQYSTVQYRAFRSTPTGVGWHHVEASLQLFWYYSNDQLWPASRPLKPWVSIGYMHACQLPAA